jgi:TolA-binding protein
VDGLLERTEKLDPRETRVLEDMMRAVLEIRRRQVTEVINQLRYQMDEAVKSYLEAAEIEDSPTGPDDLIAAAQIQMRAGKLADAKDLYQKVIDRFPESLRAREARDGIERIRAREGS